MKKLASACLFLAGLTAASAQNYSFTTIVNSTAATSLKGIAVDPAGTLYVNDNYTVYRVGPTGALVVLADRLDTVSTFGATDVAVTPSGTVFFTSAGGTTLEQITAAGAHVVVAGRTGVRTSADGPGPDARFNSAVGLASDRAGNLFVGDAYTIRKVTPASVVTTFAGTAGVAGNADGIGSSAQFRGVIALTVDAAGNLFVVDGGNSAIRKITPSGGVTTLTNNATAGPALKSPSGVAVDTAGNLFIVDNGNFVIRKLTPAGEMSTIGGQFGQIGSTDGIGGAALFGYAARIAIDAANNLYITDGLRIRKGVPTNAPSAPLITAPIAAAKLATAAGVDTTLTVDASGTGPFTYQWLKNGQRISGATNATLTLTNVTPADTGTYAATVSNSAGSATSNATTYTVNVPLQTSFAQRNVRNGGSQLWGIASGNGKLVTVGTNGRILTSVDGRTWTPAVSGTTDWLVGVTFGAGKFVAVGDHGRILVSTDGVSWTSVVTTATTQRLNNVLYAAGIFVAVGEGGSIVTSTDALIWTARSSGVSTWLRGLTYNANAGYFTAGGQNGVLFYSNDGATWSLLKSGDLNFDLEALTSVGSYADFVGIGSFGRAVFVNRTASTGPALAPDWTTGAINAGVNVRLRGLAQGASALFATGELGVILAAPSAFGPWTSVPSGTSANLVSGLYVGDTLYVVGDNETILQSDSLFNSRLQNISTRAQVGTSENAMFSGFVITGTVPKQVLVRAAGPALTGFGLSGALAAPVLTLYDSLNRPIFTNTRWSTATNAAAIATTSTRVGAFPFGATSADSALLVTLTPGLYSAQVAGANNTTGLALVEAYDADVLSNTGSRTINISTRARVGTGSDKIIAGFVITGAAARRVLIRGIGPTLGSFGVPGTLAEPQLELYNSSGNLLLTAGPWNAQPNEAEIRTAALAAGAFALAEGAKDSAVVATLLPGQWTVQISGVNNSTGVALVEVYDLP